MGHFEFVQGEQFMSSPALTGGGHPSPGGREGATDLYAEGCAATAGLFGVGVLELEALPVQAV